MSFEKEKWLNPPKKYRVYQMLHEFPAENRTVLMDCLNDFGFGGAVTNPDHRKGFENFDEACRAFNDIAREMIERGLDYWIYDECGYPSGLGGGKTLEGHRELEAKGFYMYRAAAYEDRHFTYHLDDDSDKIVWAAAYPLDMPMKHQSYVRWNEMTPVPFEERKLECDMKAGTVLYIFNVRAAHIGSQATHNTCSFERYINIMNPDAVRRYLDIAFEPLARSCPQALKDAGAIFTDEPSLMTNYVRDYETWNFALCPWMEGLFEAYEKEYGESMLPQMPLLFEGTTEAYPIRVRFYRLVGKLIAKAYSGQIEAWCKEHGTMLSGHYLAEETEKGQLGAYGSYVDVVKAAGYPGIDILTCYPEIVVYDTFKHGQMVPRKKGTNGMMVEICPFADEVNFAKAPVDNMSGVMSMLYMSGVRHTNSYFSADYSEYDRERLKKYRNGYMKRADAIAFNAFVGRMGYMLDGLMNDTHTFVYYGIENTAAQKKPGFTGEGRVDDEPFTVTNVLAKKLIEAGHDFYYADRDDLLEAVSTDKPFISGIPVETVIVPPMDVMYDESFAALKTLEARGVKVLFLEHVPMFGTDKAVLFHDTETLVSLASPKTYVDPVRNVCKPVSADDILAYLDEYDADFTVEAGGAMIHKARFIKDGRELWMVYNNTRADVEAIFRHKEKKTAVVYHPQSGEITPVAMGDAYTLPMFRAVFVWFD